MISFSNQKWGLALGLGLMLASQQSFAACTQTKQEQYFSKLNAAKASLVTQWVQGSPAKEMVRNLSEAIINEQFLIARSCVSFSNTALISPLSGKDENTGLAIRSTSDLPVMAYRVFKQRVHELSGFQPEIVELTTENTEIRSEP